MGVVYQGYNSHYMPGWFDGTVGYHADDGKIFGAHCGDNLGREVAGDPVIRLIVIFFLLLQCDFDFESSLLRFLMNSFILRGFCSYRLSLSLGRNLFVLLFWRLN